MSPRKSDAWYRAAFRFRVPFEEVIKHCSPLIDSDELDLGEAVRRPSTNITSEGAERRGDMDWMVPYRNRPGGVIVHLEFQTRTDPEMPFRMVQYGTLAQTDAMRESQEAGRLACPEGFGVVVYSGAPRWSADGGVSPGDSGGMGRRPSPWAPYCVLDLQAIAADPAAAEALPKLMGRVESEPEAGIPGLLTWLEEECGGPEHGEMRRTFARLLADLLAAHPYGAEIEEQIRESEAMSETERTMTVAETLVERCLAKGRTEGRAEGQAKTLGRLAGRMHGAAAGSELGSLLSARENGLDGSRVMDAILDSGSAEEMLARVRGFCRVGGKA